MGTLWALILKKKILFKKKIGPTKGNAILFSHINIYIYIKRFYLFI